MFKSLGKQGRTNKNRIQGRYQFAPQRVFHSGCGEVKWKGREYGATGEAITKSTITAIKLLFLRYFQRKVLCNSGLQAKSTTFAYNNSTRDKNIQILGLKNIEIQVITNLSQEEQIEVINMKENEIFSIVRNGLYDQYLKLITNIDINSQNEYGQNLLQEAIEANKDKIAIDLVNKRIDINHQDDKGFSSLHYCAQFSNINIAELLLKNNANINIVDSYGNNPLWTAVFNTCEDYQMVRLFMKYGADAHHKNKANRSPIDFAQQIEDVDMVKILLG